MVPAVGALSEHHLVLLLEFSQLIEELELRLEQILVLLRE